MERYSIAQVEALTGIQAPTLRMWEKRYGFLIPHRTDTNIRYYSDDQLKKLLNISVLIEAGYKISKLASMPEDTLHAASAEVQTTGNAENAEIKALVVSMLEYDELRFNEIFQVSVIRKGLLQTMTSLIYPFLRQVGVLWGTSRLMPAQEHFISNIIKRKLFTAIDGISEPAKDTRKVILFLPEQEEHELGLLLSYFIFKNAGWKAFYLGQNVPLENIRLMEESVKPDVLCTFLITPSSEPEKRFQRILEQTHAHLLVSGSAQNLPAVPSDLRFTKLSSPEDLLTFIRNNK